MENIIREHHVIAVNKDGSSGVYVRNERGGSFSKVMDIGRTSLQTIINLGINEMARGIVSEDGPSLISMKINQAFDIDVNKIVVSERMLIAYVDGTTRDKPIPYYWY